MNSGPDKLVRISTGLFEDFRAGLGNPHFDLRPHKLVEGIARHNRSAETRAVRIEARRPAATIQNPQIEVLIREVEHRTVLVERPAPRKDFIEREHVTADPADAPDSLSTSCRCPAARIPLRASPRETPRIRRAPPDCLPVRDPKTGCRTAARLCESRPRSDRHERQQTHWPSCFRQTR